MNEKPSPLSVEGLREFHKQAEVMLDMGGASYGRREGEESPPMPPSHPSATSLERQCTSSHSSSHDDTRQHRL